MPASTSKIEPSLIERARGAGQRCTEAVRGFTEGVGTEDLRRLFERDAAEAYAVLTRGRPEAAVPGEEPGFFASVKDLFLGLSEKLSPPRRVLFVGALVATLLGFVELGVGRIGVESDEIWFVVAVGLLVFLLALELVDRVRVRDELEVARTLQLALLPQEEPELPDWRVRHTYRIANEVGGDYYGFPRLPDGRIAVSIGDASGHGMAAGLLMAIANATLGTALDLDPTPRRVAHLLNRALVRTGDRRAFMTFFYALLDPATGRIEWVSAGHPYPLLRRADGRVEELGEGGFPLGIREDLEPATGEARLEPGDLLLLFTDGLAEALSPTGDAFGFERVARTVRAGGDAATVRDNLLHAFDRHRGEAPLADDLTLLVLERLQPPPGLPLPDGGARGGEATPPPGRPSPSPEERSEPGLGSPPDPPPPPPPPPAG